jgi:hypothetical protein
MISDELERLRKYLVANYPELQTESTSDWAKAALERLDADLGYASHELTKKGRTIAAQLAAGGRIFSDLLGFHADEVTKREEKISSLGARVSVLEQDLTRSAEMSMVIATENDRLQDICASAYQLAGVVGAPVRFLDILSNPTDATPEQIDALLPVGDDEIDAVRERGLFKSLIDTVIEIPNLSDEDLAVLRANCQAVIKGNKAGQ